VKRGTGTVRIELYGIARLRAGRSALDVAAGNLAEALVALVRRCPNVEPEVVRAGLLCEGFLASRNGELFLPDPRAPLEAGDTLLILSSQAGG
jgi:molybdopterin converting factor small subunit